jgi:transcriptional regulator with XRE-family HTH domain
MKNQFGNRIRELRESNKLLQRQVASILEIDTPMLSKIERGERKAKREQVVSIAKLLNFDVDELLSLWLADQVIAILDDKKEICIKALDIAKENMKK